MLRTLYSFATEKGSAQADPCPSPERGIASGEGSGSEVPDRHAPPIEAEPPGPQHGAERGVIIIPVPIGIGCDMRR